MNKKLNKLFVTILTILVVTLVASFLKELIDDNYKDGRSPYTSVWIGMAVMVAVYYPMSLFLTKYFSAISRKYLRHYRRISKSNILGLLLGFIVAILVLFGFYAKVWYDLNVLEDFIKIFK